MDDNSSLLVVVVVLMLLWIQSTRLTAAVGGGSGVTAVSQQGLELSTLLVLKLTVCLYAAYYRTEM